MKLKDYISEAVSHGRHRKYIESSAIPNLETILEKDMVRLLENLTFKNFKKLNPGKDYGYSTSSMNNFSDINYMFNYIKNNFSTGDVVWHWFEKTNTVVIVVLNNVSFGGNSGKSALFKIQFAFKSTNDGHMLGIFSYLGKETNTAIGTKTIYLENAKTSFDVSVEVLKDILSKYE